MSDIYTPNTTGGEAGEFIHDELEELLGEEQSRKPNGPSNLLPVQEYEELVDHEGNTYTVPKPIEYPVDQIDLLFLMINMKRRIGRNLIMRPLLFLLLMNMLWVC